MKDWPVQPHRRKGKLADQETNSASDSPRPQSDHASIRKSNYQLLVVHSKRNRIASQLLLRFKISLRIENLDGTAPICDGDFRIARDQRLGHMMRQSGFGKFLGQLNRRPDWHRRNIGGLLRKDFSI